MNIEEHLFSGMCRRVVCRKFTYVSAYFVGLLVGPKDGSAGSSETVSKLLPDYRRENVGFIQDLLFIIRHISGKYT
jgi:hypothetical protein